jgi:hypothetical protein
VIAVKYIVEATLKEIPDSYHGDKIDFEKELVRAVGDIYNVMVYRITDEDGETYYPQRDGTFTGKAMKVGT